MSLYSEQIVNSSNVIIDPLRGIVADLAKLNKAIATSTWYLKNHFKTTKFEKSISSL